MHDRSFAEMSFNPLPFLFAPGVAGVGYALAGLAGAVAALLGWTAIVVLATACVMICRSLRHARESHARESYGDEDVGPLRH